MSVLSPRIRFVEFLRKYRPLYSLLRALFRTLKFWPVSVLRACLPNGRTFGYPRSFYSGVELVRSGALPGKILHEGQTPPVFQENSLVKISRLVQDGNQPWPIFWFLQKEACLTSSSLGLRDGSGRLLAESTFSQTGWPGDPAYWHFATPPKVKFSGNVTSLVSFWETGGYWHFLLDGVSRLALLPEFPPDTRILVRPLRPWQRWFLKEMGLEDRLIETAEKSVWIENYYFSAPSAMTGCYNAFAVDFLRQQFLDKASTRGTLPRRFYILRQGFTRGVCNEEEVRAFFQRRGWGLIAPETLSIPEQIELFSQAEAMVGLHGSAFANLIWCPTGACVVELAPSNFLAGAFEIVARQLGMRHGFIICPADHRSYVEVDLAVLEAKLEEFGL